MLSGTTNLIKSIVFFSRKTSISSLVFHSLSRIYLKAFLWRIRNEVAFSNYYHENSSLFNVLDLLLSRKWLALLDFEWWNEKMCSGGGIRKEIVNSLSSLRGIVDNTAHTKTQGCEKKGFALKLILIVPDFRSSYPFSRKWWLKIFFSSSLSFHWRCFNTIAKVEKKIREFITVLSAHFFFFLFVSRVLEKLLGLLLFFIKYSFISLILKVV